MPKEEFYEPTKGEVDEAVANAEEQMNEFNKSRPPKKRVMPRPTKEGVDEAMRAVAEQFGEKFEAGDPAVPEEDIIGKCEKEGWELMTVVRNPAEVDISHKEGKEIKIVELGKKFLVFERDKKKEE